jgi:hypothetical protein
MRTIGISSTLLACLLVAGCDKAKDSGNETAANAVAANAADTVGNAANATVATTSALAAYVGKYPFDKVAGVAFLDNPLVKAGVEKTVPDKDVRQWLLSPDSGPADMVFKSSRGIASWACEAHNCGDHNWTLFVDEAAGTTQVCYHDAETMQDQSRWYDGKGGTAMKPDQCPADANAGQ